MPTEDGCQAVSLTFNRCMKAVAAPIGFDQPAASKIHG